MKIFVTLALGLLVGPAVSLRAADAKENWTMYCAQCHGADGTAKTPMGKKFNAKNLTDPKVQAAYSDAQMTKSIKEGVKKNDIVTMKAFGDKLSDDEVKALIAYVRSLKKEL